MLDTARHLVKALIVVIGVLPGAVTGLGAESLPGEWISDKLIGSKSGREFKLYVPAAQQGKALPLVVMLHGCAQGAEVFAESTGMNAIAEKAPFLVLYPEQKASANAARCWNWFLESHQRRDSGEPAEIVAMVEQVARQRAIDRKRIYVAGLSAGASMSVILAVCYPEVFAAAGVHSGTLYKSASGLASAQKLMLTAKGPDPDALGAEAWACGGKRQALTPVMVWHGQGDNVVNRRNGDHVVRQFATLNDWADDGRGNRSLPQQPVRESGQVAGGYRYTITRYEHRGRPLIEYFQVEKMGHAWSGGKGDVRFSDAKGPNASALMWDFFRQFSR